MAKKNNMKLIIGIVAIVLLLGIGLSQIKQTSTHMTDITDKLRIYDSADLAVACGSHKYCKGVEIIVKQEFSYQDPEYRLICECRYPRFALSLT